MRTWKS